MGIDICDAIPDDTDLHGEAVNAFLRLALRENPAYPLANRFLASCYIHLGRMDEARQVVARLRAITPAVVRKTTNYRDPVQREMFLSGLRLAADATA